MPTHVDESIVIKVSGVSKNFKLPHQRRQSVKSMFTNMLSLGNKTYETQHALKDISFEIKKGEFFGIVGRNGSGKSTLLKILAGIYQPTKGSVEVKGKLVPFIELGVGFNPELTGRENVFLNGSILGFSEKEVKANYHTIVEFAELEDFMDQKLKNYSSGMQVRLAFACATMAKADVLLIDEVLAVGDADFQRKCFNYFKQIKKAGTTVIFVTHDMNAVREYCDRALLIDGSKIRAVGAATSIASKYSKMFTNEAYVRDANSKKKASKTSKNLSPSGEERWGDGLASVVSVVGTVDNKEMGGVITIRGKIKANKDIQEPILGFSVKDENFKQITGLNTVRLNKKLSPMKKGQISTISWTVPNIFNEGRYYVDFTVATDTATNVADRWPEAVSFNIYRAQKSNYPIVLDGIKFKIERTKSL
jgi:ABC-2 type transport system ATP-binding protein